MYSARSIWRSAPNWRQRSQDSADKVRVLVTTCYILPERHLAACIDVFSSILDTSTLPRTQMKGLGCQSVSVAWTTGIDPCIGEVSRGIDDGLVLAEYLEGHSVV